MPLVTETEPTSINPVIFDLAANLQTLNFGVDFASGADKTIYPNWINVYKTGGLVGQPVHFYNWQPSAAFTTGSVTASSCYYNMLFNVTAPITWAGTYIYDIDSVTGSIVSVSPETPEQQAERLVREVQLKLKRGIADKRAEELLLMLLNEKQQQQYSDLGYFETQINDKLYRIRKGHSGNVRLLIDGKEKEKFCAHPQDAYLIPEQDSMIAQYLMLCADEKAFLAKANRTVLYA